ncbi:hypothetical protein QCA50_020154 [Cerrena zonata]|uniref:RBR-type E3 ubiquitin transferase n=1 Tax=Cerrena zonata TaxID=2478898 RepID=A0AAW0F8G7_9APHY
MAEAPLPVVSAALNCARFILTKERDGVKGAELIRMMMRKDTLESILSICQAWTSNAHLDVDDILNAPLFNRCLDLLWSDFETPGKKEFQGLLQRLHMRVNGSAAIIITRPPEIICILKIAVEDQNVFVTFDSHPRHEHPEGAAFTFHSSLEEASVYLSNLLRYDPGLLADRNMQWQTQLLANYSGHVLRLKNSLTDQADLMKAVIDSSLEVLALKAEVAELKRQNGTLHSDNRHLEDRAAALEIRSTDLLDSLRLARTPQFPFQPRPSSSFTPAVNRSNAFAATNASSSSSRPLSRADSRRNRRGSQSTARSTKHQSSPAIVSRTQSKGKLVTKSEELRDGDVLFGTRLSFRIEDEQPDVRNNATPEQTLPRQEDFPPLVSTKRDKGKGKARWVETEKTFSDTDEAYATYLQIQLIPEDKGNGNDDPSAVLAAQKQAEFEEEDRRLRAQLQALQEATPSVFTCGICLEEKSEEMVARIDLCQHAFCRDCIRSYLQTKLAEHRFPILCPSCTAERTTHKPGMLDVSLVQLIGLTEKESALYVELEMASFSVLLHCRKCKQAAFVDKGEYDEEKIIVCPVPGCRHVWCKACSATIDVSGPNHSCDGSSELNHLMKRQGWKYCPGCRTPAEKISGCNHITCVSPGCNTHFCYVCGELIVQSALRQEIEQGLSDHYSRCQLIDNIPPDTAPRRPRIHGPRVR